MPPANTKTTTHITEYVTAIIPSYNNTVDRKRFKRKWGFQQIFHVVFAQRMHALTLNRTRLPWIDFNQPRSRRRRLPFVRAYLVGSTCIPPFSCSTATTGRSRFRPKAQEYRLPPKHCHRRALQPKPRNCVYRRKP